MAGHLRFPLLLLCASFLAAVAGHGYGQGVSQPSTTLADPTRPPAIFLEGAPTAEAITNEPPPVGLQAVIMRKGARPLAVINGQTVQLGDKVGDAKLVKLSETEAVLQGPNGKEVMRMTPGIERKAISKNVQESSTGPKKSRLTGGKAAAPKKNKIQIDEVNLP